MKTNTRHISRQWKGANLPATIESLDTLNDGQIDVVLGSSFDAENLLQMSLLSTLTSTKDRSILIYYPGIEEEQSVSEYTVDELIGYLIGPGFSEAVYILDSSESFLVYSNSRDSLSIWLVPPNLMTAGELEAWDEEFNQHMEELGIGFGDEGKAYIKYLLTELAEKDARTTSRFSKMLHMR